MSILPLMSLVTSLVLAILASFWITNPPRINLHALSFAFLVLWFLLTTYKG